MLESLPLFSQDLSAPEKSRPGTSSGDGPFGRRRSWKDYREHLVADPARVLLLNERAATDRMLQKLSDRREELLFEREGYRWPHPGVYRLQDYAQAVLKELERSAERRLASALRLPTKIEALQKWLALCPPEFSVLDAAEDLAACQIFHALDLTFIEWKDILARYEDSSELELKQLTQRILRFLRFEAGYVENAEFTSNWHFLELAREAFENPVNEHVLDKNFFLRLAGRPPPCFERPHVLVVPCLHEFYPAERRLLESLAGFARRRPDVLTVECVQSAESYAVDSPVYRERLRELAARIATLPPAETAIAGRAARDIALAGTERGYESSANEALALVPGTFPLDIADPRKARGEPLLSHLRAALDYQRQSRPADHRFLRDRARSGEILLDHGFAAALAQAEELSAEEFWRLLLDGLERQNPLRVDELEKLRDQGEWPRSRHWLSVLAEQGFFDFVHPPAQDSFRGRIDPNGVLVASLEEALLLGTPRIVLWGAPERVIEGLAGAHVLALRDFVVSPQLDRLIEAQGKILPSPKEESAALLAALAEFDAVLERLPPLGSDESPGALPQAPPAREFFRLQFSSAGLLEPLSLSASGISTYARCSMQYAIRQLWRFDVPEEWDPQSVPRNKRGQWIHRVLELLYRLPTLPDPLAPWLEATFLRTLPESFAERASAPYRQLIEAQIPELVQRLGIFLDAFESSWRPLPRARERVLTEQFFRGTHWDVSWSGVIDRIDVLASGDLLLWDYKSGKSPQGDIAKQIAKGHLQWPLYAALAEALGPGIVDLGIRPGARVLGGGYLQALEPEDSALFCGSDEWQPFFARLAEKLGCAWHPWDRERDLGGLAREVERLRDEIRAENFVSRPLEEATCTFCSVASFCGRPSLRVEGALPPNLPSGPVTKFPEGAPDS